ncbi:hypothetical protein RRG08_067330, partial [Elysia crispata]
GDSLFESWLELSHGVAIFRLLPSLVKRNVFVTSSGGLESIIYGSRGVRTEWSGQTESSRSEWIRSFLAGPFSISFLAQPEWFLRLLCGCLGLWERYVGEDGRVLYG